LRALHLELFTLPSQFRLFTISSKLTTFQTGNESGALPARSLEEAVENLEREMIIDALKTPGATAPGPPPNDRAIWTKTEPWAAHFYDKGCAAKRSLISILCNVINCLWKESG